MPQHGVMAGGKWWWIYSNHLSSSLAKSAKFLWRDVQPLQLIIPLPLSKLTHLWNIFWEIFLFSQENPLRQTRNELFFLHVPTARNDWSRMVFNERQIPPAPEDNQKWGDLFPPSGFEAQNCCLQSLRHFSVARFDDVRARPVLPKAVDQILWTCVHC